MKEIDPTELKRNEIYLIKVRSRKNKCNGTLAKYCDESLYINSKLHDGGDNFFIPASFLGQGSAYGDIHVDEYKSAFNFQSIKDKEFFKLHFYTVPKYIIYEVTKEEIEILKI
jgi:hypothetical protein